MNKNILIEKKKNNKNISPLKVPLKSAIKKKPSAEGNSYKNLKGKNNNIDEHNFNAAFAMVRIIKYYNESHAEDNNNNSL